MPFEGIHNEKQLLTQVSQGDRQAFQVLYKSCYPLIQRYILLFEPSPYILDELTQDVFVRIWEKLASGWKLRRVFQRVSFPGDAQRNVVFNFIRALKVRQKVKELDESSSPPVNDLENELLFKQYYEIALEAMNKLPPGRRKVLKMSIDDGLSLDEIATELSISRSGVKKQLYAATAYVRQYLQEHGEITLALIIFLSLFEG